MSEPVVVDTNVLLVANGSHGETDAACRAKCARELARIMGGSRRLVLDAGWEILGEYGHKLDPKGPPTVGNRFLKWALTNQANPRACDRVRITPDPERVFREFPEHPGLSDFDPPDRKFIAVARAHPGRPPVLQATDSKWVGWRKALGESGVRVEFVCARQLERAYRKKFPGRTTAAKTTRGDTKR